MNMGKAVAIDAASTTTSYWTGYACNEMGLPLPLTLMLSMGAGMGTSYGLNSIFFKSNSIHINSNTSNPRLDATYFDMLSIDEKKVYIKEQSGSDIYQMVNDGGGQYSWITKSYDLITEDNIKDFLIVREDGSLNLDWPKYGGLELDSIDSVGSLSGKISVSRSGSDTGYTIGYIAEEGDSLATNSQRSIPVSESVVHTGTMDIDRYKQIVDIINSGESDNQIISSFGKLGIDEYDAYDLINEYELWIKREEISGKYGIINGLKSKDISIDNKYGFYGNAAEWTVGDVYMEGGAGQINIVFSWGTLKDTGIVMLGEDVVIN